MKKVQNGAGKDSALDELCKRYETRGRNYSKSPEYAEQESRENLTRTVAPRSYKVSGGAGRDVSEFKSGVSGKRRYMTDADFAEYYRSSREYTPDANVELDTVVLLHRMDRNRYEKKKYTAVPKVEKKDIKAELKREADRANPKTNSKDQGKESGGKAEKKASKNKTISAIKQEAKVAAKTWIPLDEMKNEKIEDGERTTLPLGTIAAIIIVALSLLLIVTSTVLISTAKQEQSELKSTIEDLDKEIDRLTEELNEKNEGADIEIYAKEELGMISQEYARLEYINSNKTDELEKNGEPFSLLSFFEGLFPFLK